MKRLIAPAFAILGLIASCVVANPTARAQQGGGSGLAGPQPFTFTAAGQSSPILLLNGQGNCSVQIDNVGGGVTITAQSTSDQNPSLTSPWTKATNVGGGDMTSADTYTGTIATTTHGGLTGFRVYATALTSGTASGKISCSNAQGAISVTVSGGTVQVSPIPLPVSPPTCPGAPNAPCVQITGAGISVVVSPIPLPVSLSPNPYPVTTPIPAITDSQGIVYTHPTELPNPLPVTTAPPDTPYVAPTCPGAPNAPCVQLTGLPNPLPVTTSVPYVAPTCPGAPNAPCVQITGAPTVNQGLPGPAGSPWPVVQAPVPVGGSGASPSPTLANLNATAQCVKATGSTLLSAVAVNTQASLAAYVDIYDSATGGGVTIGTGIKAEVLVPAGLNAFFDIPSFGWKFTNGICFVSTTTSQIGGGNTGSANGVQLGQVTAI